MEYLEQDAAEIFHLLSVRSYNLHLIGRADLELRLACLRDMLNPGDHLHESLSSWLPKSLMLEEELPDESFMDESVIIEKYSDCMIGRAERREAFPLSSGLQLIVRGVSGMKKWIFHEHDADCHPSIPHGHEHQKHHSKCDPYTGKVYDARRREIAHERISRQVRIALWRDSKFREFAMKSIIWYENSYPYYKFRVPNPRRLPRRRAH